MTLPYAPPETYIPPASDYQELEEALDDEGDNNNDDDDQELRTALEADDVEPADAVRLLNLLSRR